MHNELDDCSRHLLKLLEAADPDIERLLVDEAQHLASTVELAVRVVWEFVRGVEQLKARGGGDEA